MHGNRLHLAGGQLPFDSFAAREAGCGPWLHLPQRSILLAFGRFWGNSRHGGCDVRLVAGCEPLQPAILRSTSPTDLGNRAAQPRQPRSSTRQPRKNTELLETNRGSNHPRISAQLGRTRCQRGLLAPTPSPPSSPLVSLVIGGTRTTTTVAGSPPGTGGPAGTLSPGRSWRSPGTYGDPPLERVPVCPRFPRPECAMRFTERSTRDHPRC